MFHQTPKGFKAQKKMKNPAEGSDNLRPMGNLAGVAQWIEHGPVKQSERFAGIHGSPSIAFLSLRLSSTLSK